MQKPASSSGAADADATQPCHPGMTVPAHTLCFQPPGGALYLHKHQNGKRAVTGADKAKLWEFKKVVGAFLKVHPREKGCEHPSCLSQTSTETSGDGEKGHGPKALSTDSV